MKGLSWKIGFGIGVCLIIIGIAIFLLPIFSEVSKVQPHGRLSSAYSNNLILTSLQWNFITHTSPQELYINYSAITVEEEDGFIAFFIPYPGNIKQGSG